MLLGKSKKFKIYSLVLAAVLSTCLISCQSSNNGTETSSNTTQESQTENKEQDTPKETENKESEETNSEESSATMDSSTMDYHSAQAVDNANKTHEGFESSDNEETAPEGKVYILQGSTKYHTKSNCGGLNKAKCIDKSIAETAGYKPCPDCAK